MDDFIQAIIWDMGGVLLRTEDPEPRKRLAGRLGTPLEELYRFIFTSDSAKKAENGIIRAEEHWEAIRQHYGLSEQGLVQFKEEFWGGDRVDQELVDKIRSLRSRYQTGLLSNAWSDGRHLAADTFHILDAFDLCVFSAEVGVSKPAPEIYQFTLKQLKLQPQQVVFIDDMPANVEGAEAVGMHAIRFESQTQVLQALQKYASFV